MNAANPNLPLLESVVAALGPLCSRFVFVGGCVTGLLVTDAASPSVRATRDVDAIVQVVSLGEYHALERQLEKAGLRHDHSPEAPVCRWLAGGALLDVMPTDKDVLGFGNCWYEEAVRTALTLTLPSGTPIRMIAAPVFLATKLEAFADRGQGDYLASHDLEDITTIVDGRPELVEETAAASPDVRRRLSTQFQSLLQTPAFMNALPGHLPGDPASQARLPLILERLRQLSTLR
ncbi:MAG TPA: hypothetical protein VGR92_04770 [Steroidobacteraceae bacterium]|nr:hypothetical protein [Steroidobacteraceae bacterium]